jgi:hypothetical protein
MKHSCILFTQEDENSSSFIAHRYLRMKRTSIACILAFFLSQSIYAQFYQIELDLYFITKEHHMECDTYADVTITYTDGSTSERKYTVPGEINENRPFLFNDSFTANKPVRSIKCVGHHRDDPTSIFVGCKERGNGSINGTISDYEYPCISKTYKGFLGKYDGGSYLNLRVTPIPMEITYEANGLPSGGDQKLPDAKKIKMLAPGGYHESVYVWKYRIGNGGENTISSQFEQEGGRVLEISGNDIISNFSQLIGVSGNAVSIWIDYECGKSNTIVLTPTLTAPEIVSATAIDRSCGENGSGGFQVTLSRPLYPEETLNFAVKKQGSSDDYDDMHYGWSYLKVDPGNPQVVTFPNFDWSGAETDRIVLEGTYTIGLMDYYQNELQAAYTDGSAAFNWGNLEVKAPVPVEWNGAIKATPVTCPNGNDGTLTLSAKGGNGSYIVKLHRYGETDPVYTSEPFQGQTIITGLSSDDYQVYLYDTAGCEAESNPEIGTIDEPDEAFEIEFVEMERASLDESLQEENNGFISVEVSAGHDSYHYTWKSDSKEGPVLLETDSEANTSSLKAINSGVYYLEISNSKGCSIDTLIVLPKAPEIIISITQNGIVYCSGDHTGELQATVSGGTEPYQYKWYSINEYTGEETLVSMGNPVLSGIPAGPYRLIVEDIEGFKARSAVFYQTEENPITADFTTQGLSCHSDANGFLEITVDGGTAPYTYQWDNGSTDVRIENLPKGSYGIVVTDYAGCFKYFIGTVTAPTPMKMNAVAGHLSCFESGNGSLRLQISGGNEPYAISWSNGATQPTINSLSAGNYSVTVEDGNGCETLNETYTLFQPEPIEIQPVSYRPISAFGQSNGMFSFSVRGGTPPYSSVCKNDKNQSFYPKTILDQGDGSTLIVYDGMPDGSYEATVTDRNYQQNPTYSSCKAVFLTEIKEPPLLSVNIYESHLISCFEGSDGELRAEGIGGEPDFPTPYFYEWFKVEGYNRVFLASGSDVLSDLSQGTYVVKVTDKNGVSAFSIEYRLFHPGPLNLSLDIKDVSCNGGNNGSVTAFANGGAGDYSYQWSSGETTSAISGKGTGEYSVTVTDQRGCQISTSAFIHNPDSFAINVQSYPITCFGNDDGAIYLDIEGGSAPYSYEWSNGLDDPYIENLKPGAYNVKITDSEGCSTDTAFFIPPLDSIAVVLSELKPPIGFGHSGGSLSVEISGGNTPPYTVYWSNSSGDPLVSEPLQYSDGKAISVLADLPEGNYFIRVEDANYSTVVEENIDSCGCMHTASFYLPQPPKLIVSIEKSQDILCFGSDEGEISSTVEGGVPFETGLPYTYEWERDGTSFRSGTAILSGLQIGSYRLKVTDANGISAVSEPIQLTQPDEMQLTFQSAEIKCSRDATGWAEVSVSGGISPYTYEWSTGDLVPHIENLSRGKYMVWVHDANGCEVTGVTEIIQANAIQVQATLTEPTCFGGSDGKISISLSKGEPPYSYQWENGLESLVYTGLSKGSYTFTVTDVHGCGYETETFDLGEPGEITVDLGEDRELCIGQTATIQAQLTEAARSFTWYDSSGKILHTGEEYTLSEAGVYTVEAVTAKGCIGYGQVTITRDDRDIAADFVVASRVPIYDDVYLVNISDPAPDRVEWLLPEQEGYEVLSESQEVLTLAFHKYGEYTVGMRSYSGKCWETIYKSIQVMDKIDIDHYEEADGPMLKTFTISPNPAKERFTVSIELKETSPVNLYLIQVGTGKIIARRYLSGSKVYSEQFEHPNAQPGTYVLSLDSPLARAAKKLIVRN